ncbi:hypothetical protein L3X38_030760 [Prunus dulcis]|uniref:Uncharacterized protein n=1 Tax=Prunus dulcis TaxID=3755 RepID=A0AAD4VAU0_PRUDU|nr:hypothetical protein L3X38_030760 [Prunus dulcis]
MEAQILNRIYVSTSEKLKLRTTKPTVCGADYLVSSETWNGVCPCDFGFVSAFDGVCFVLLFVPMLWSGRLCACSFLYVG